MVGCCFFCMCCLCFGFVSFTQFHSIQSIPPPPPLPHTEADGGINKGWLLFLFPCVLSLIGFVLFDCCVFGCFSWQF